MTTASWNPLRPLGPTDRVLLEASAGTGKTYQTEGLVVRLVAEYGVPIDKILVITFTKAATADLRKRIRARLEAALEAVTSGAAEPDDVVVGALVGGPQAARAARRERLAAALAAYDQAPISTIHGFCQRTLGELSLEADQDPDLDVVSEALSIRDELVADALATVFAQAKEPELATLHDMGWTPANLRKVTKLMTGPTEPLVEPPVERAIEPPTEPIVEPQGAGESPASGPVACARKWLAEVAAVRAWLATEEGEAARAALLEDAGRELKPKKKSGGLPRRIGRVTKTNFDDRWGKLVRWLDHGGPAGSLPDVGADAEWIEKNWSQTHLDANWKGGDETFAGLEVYRRVTALRDLRPALWPRPLADFACTVRAAFEGELARRAWLTYDGMLSQLAARLDKADGADLAAAIRERYDVAIVDEFQDTDGAQWGILRAVFHAPSPASPRRFYAVGDPKQAIYSFRNASLAVYLDAADACERHRLPRNHRSDGPLVNAINHLWGHADAPFDDARIAYAEVGAQYGSRIDGLAPVPVEGQARPRRALEVRLFDGRAGGFDADAKLTKPLAQQVVAELCAAECRRLLESEATITLQDAPAKPVGPGDLAVLVRTHEQGEMVRLALRRHGIPAVSANQRSIFESVAVDWLRAFLDAVAAPTREQNAKWLALSPLMGWSPAALMTALSAPSGEDDKETLEARKSWENLRQQLVSWADRWSRLGVFRVFAAFAEAYGVFPRLVGGEPGERGATDLRHLLELCHVEERRTRSGPHALTQWLERMAAEEADEGAEGAEAVERVQRLESDAKAVQIVTVHACKGLQYPIALVPFAWGTAPRVSDNVGPLAYDARDAGGPARTVVNLEIQHSKRRTAAKNTISAERWREEMRLLYVALTRAKHHTVVWTSAMAVKLPGAIHRLLGQRKGVDDAEVLDALTATPTTGVGWALEKAPTAVTDRWTQADSGHEPQGELAAATWSADRRLGANWMVTSFSALSTGKGHDVDGSRLRETATVEGAHEAEHEDERGDAYAGPADHSAAVDTSADLATWVTADPSLLEEVPGAKLPGGTRNGLWLHAVFEHLDFYGDAGTTGRGKHGESAEDVVREQAAQHGTTNDEHIALVGGLLPRWLDTPLDVPLPPGGPGPLPEGFSLRDLKVGDHLDELVFDLRLGDGARWAPSRRSGPGDYTGRVDPRAVRHALEAALEDPAFGGRSWLAQLLSVPGRHGEERRILPAIAGLMTGSIDLAFRVGGTGAEARYYIADYKSNVVRGSDGFRAKLGQVARAQGAGDDRWKLRRVSYTRPLLTWAMAHAAYPLQALVYTVALHRLLRQRLGAGYRYDTHMGGHFYLFLRGMEGRRRGFDGLPLGVYGDRWPARTVIGLDVALSGGTLEAVKAAMDAHGGQA